MAYVYCITNKINGKKYIGSSRKETIDITYFGSGKIIQKALQKYGKDNFIRQILWEGEGDARDIETYWLEYFNAANNPLFYNMTNDARGNNLHKEETKKTVSEKLTGRKFTKEICKKISDAKIGKSNPKKGKLDGPKPGITKAHKGRISPNKGHTKQIALYSVDGMYIKTYNSYTELAKDININPETVRQCLVGKQHTICNKQYKAIYL